MARRRAAKAGSKAALAGTRPQHGKVAHGKDAGGATPADLLERLASLERERDALKAELDHFKARQRRLEETQEQVRDRLAWALDSLHNILEGKG